jgi:lipopolysaccharide transport system ATP-binding protein
VQLREDEFWAVKDVSFELRRGECLGLIGHNGAGKTTLLKMLNGLIKPDCGRIELNGRVGALIALGSGFNPILTGRENIYVNASILGFSKDEIDDKIGEIIEFAEIGDFIDTPVQSYSSGMQVRLGFAVAVNLKPDILLIDEVLAVGDVGFKQKAYAAIYEAIKNAAVIFVSHSISQVGKVCSRGIMMKKGAVSIASDQLHQVVDGYFAEFSSPGQCRISGSGQAELIEFEVASGVEELSTPIKLTPLHPDRCVTIAYSERVQFLFRLKLSPEIKSFYLGVGFHDMEMKGVVQFTSINHTEAFVNPQSGCCSIQVCLPLLPLNKGKYDMVFRVHEFSSYGSSAGKTLCLYENLLDLYVLSNGLIIGGYPVQLKAECAIIQDK